MAKPHADEAVHVLLAVFRHVALAGAPLDDHELVGSLDDIVFVLEQDDIAVRIDDIREARHVAEGTGVFSGFCCPMEVLNRIRLMFIRRSLKFLLELQGI